MQNVDVAVHMQERVVTGVVSLSPEERLSDFLNSDFNTQSDSSGRFLKLTDAIIDSADGIEQRGGTIYVNKEAIRILRTLETDSARGIGAKDVPKKHPFVHKLPVRATIRLSDFEVNGYLHCTNEEEILELLTKELSFLPCTDAKIHGISEDYSWKASFVAINRKQVCTIQFSQWHNNHLENWVWDKDDFIFYEMDCAELVRHNYTKYSQQKLLIKLQAILKSHWASTAFRACGWVHECNKAVFEVSSEAGQLMEIERLRDYEIKPLVVCQVGAHLSKMLEELVFAQDYEIKRYGDDDELVKLVQEYLK